MARTIDTISMNNTFRQLLQLVLLTSICVCNLRSERKYIKTFVAKRLKQVYFVRCFTPKINICTINHSREKKEGFIPYQI